MFTPTIFQNCPLGVGMGARLLAIIPRAENIGQFLQFTSLLTSDMENNGTPSPGVTPGPKM